jgi:hypothetical protein
MITQTMIYHERLEHAAKAVGYVPVGLTEDRTALLLEGIKQPWNPLIENPHSNCMIDALWLGIKLKLEISYRTTEVDVRVGDISASEYLPTYWDDDEATRHAIVRVAARIGKAMAVKELDDKQHIG